MAKRAVSLIGVCLLLSMIAFTGKTSMIDRADSESLSLNKAQMIVQRMDKAWGNINDYTVVNYKVERHGGELQPREKVFVKFKKPMSIYMKWIKDSPPEHKNPNLGQEMIYRRGWNNNKIYAHLGKRSFLPSAITSLAGLYYDYTALDPNSRAATYYQRHTIDEVPFGSIINRIARAISTAQAHPDDNVRYVDYGPYTIKGQNARCIEGNMPGAKRAAYYGDRTLLCIHEQTRMPIKIVVRRDDGVVLENYTMARLRVNVGLSSDEFSPDYSEYNF